MNRPYYQKQKQNKTNYNKYWPQKAKSSCRTLPCRISAFVDKYPEVIAAEPHGFVAGPDKGVDAGHVEALEALEFDLEGPGAGATTPDGTAGQQGEVDAP